MHLLLRADAGPRIGTGHVMRCLALAQAWLDLCGAATLMSAECPPALQQRVASEGLRLEPVRATPGGAEDARATARLARKLGARWIALDGYHFAPSYQSHLRAAGLRVLLLDDEARASSFEADLLLNQNLHVRSQDYGWRAANARLLLGSHYCLLRREFRALPARLRAIAPRARRVLVTLGGADPDNATARVLRALRLLESAELEITVLIGAAHPHAPSLLALHDPPRLAVLHDAHDVPRWMAWADLAVSAAGSTCWELCYMGLPALVLVLADNQVEIAQSLAVRGAALDLGRAAGLDELDLARRVDELLPDAGQRATLSHQGQALVDGRGAQRVASLLREAA